MVTEEEINAAQLPFEDDITRQYRQRQEDHITATLEAHQRRKKLIHDRYQLPYHLRNDVPHPDITSTMGYHVSPDQDIVFGDVHAVDRFLEELGDLMRRDVEDGRCTLQDVASPELQHIPQVPHYTHPANTGKYTKLTRRKITRKKKKKRP